MSNNFCFSLTSDLGKTVLKDCANCAIIIGLIIIIQACMWLRMRKVVCFFYCENQHFLNQAHQLSRQMIIEQVCDEYFIIFFLNRSLQHEYKPNILLSNSYIVTSIHAYTLLHTLLHTLSHLIHCYHVIITRITWCVTT